MRARVCVIFTLQYNIKCYRFNRSRAITFDKLWIILQNVTDALVANNRFDIKKFIYSWTMQRYYPVLEVIRNYSTNVATISLHFQDELDRLQYYTNDLLFPLTISVESNFHFDITSSLIWTTPHILDTLYTKFYFPNEDKWIIFNLQQNGKY